MVIYVTMVYGPIAALLVELFPTRIRYTSMSLPYHIGNGWFGGMLPLLAIAMVAAYGDIYYGLWYPIVIAVITLVIGTLFIREEEGTSIWTRTSSVRRRRRHDANPGIDRGIFLPTMRRPRQSRLVRAHAGRHRAISRPEDRVTKRLPLCELFGESGQIRVFVAPDDVRLT